MFLPLVSQTYLLTFINISFLAWKHPLNLRTAAIRMFNTRNELQTFYVLICHGTTRESAPTGHETACQLPLNASMGFTMSTE